EALNTGHEGSVTTIHANSALDAISRLASIVKQSTVGLTLDHSFILKTIKTSIDIVVFFRHTHMTEIYYNPMEKNQLLAA
ncbi:TPA: Flp pilus assembly complex ATPase component TadA, partial [Escherichia coli]|nr:Flp pilus assembly complex ATPase component TadA [Escherichia coli]